MSMNPALRSRIETLLQSNRVVLFMKGQPNMPQCGFSAKAVGALSTLGGAVAVGGELGGAAGVAVVDTARTAFTGAMRAIAVFGMAMMLLAAWMAARLMRDGEGEAHVAVVAEDAAGA